MEANTEYTFVTGNGNEFMVWFKTDGQPERIYTYKDTNGSSLIRTLIANWKVGKNPLFIHCPKGDLARAWEFLKNNAYCSELA